jgi:hypothetical protein
LRSLATADEYEKLFSQEDPAAGGALANNALSHKEYMACLNTQKEELASTDGAGGAGAAVAAANAAAATAAAGNRGFVMETFRKVGAVGVHRFK